MKRIAPIIVVCLILSAAVFPREELKTLKIASVDLDRVMAESAVIKTMVENIQDDVKSEEEAIAEKLNKYKVLKESYEKQRSILSDEQKRSRLNELEDLKMEIEDLQDKINRMIRRSDREIVEPTLERVEQAIKDVGVRYGYDMILRSDTVLYVSPDHDATELVVRMIDDPASIMNDEDEDAVRTEPEADIEESAVETSPPVPPEPTPEPTPGPESDSEDSGFTY